MSGWIDGWVLVTIGTANRNDRGSGWCHLSIHPAAFFLFSSGRNYRPIFFFPICSFFWVFNSFRSCFHSSMYIFVASEIRWLYSSLFYFRFHPSRCFLFITLCVGGGNNEIGFGRNNSAYLVLFVVRLVLASRWNDDVVSSPLRYLSLFFAGLIGPLRLASSNEVEPGCCWCIHHYAVFHADDSVSLIASSPWMCSQRLLLCFVASSC